MAEQLVLSEIADGVLTLTLNRPDKRNALNAATVRELSKALLLAAADDDVRVVLLQAAGPDFCAGADLEEMRGVAERSDPLENLADAQTLGELLVVMRRHPKPIVGAVHGRALAGGAGLANACDLVLARDDTELGYPEVHLGFVPAMVMALLRRTVGEKVAFELVTRGERIDADRAAELGLVNRVIAEEAWEVEVGDYARSLARRAPSAVKLIKRLLYGMDGLSFEEAIARGAEVNVLARLTPDTREGLREFLEKQE